MSRFSGYGSYMIFLALRTHFHSDKYDFFEMHGRVRATKMSYENRKDKWFFEKLSKMYNAQELRDFYVANFLDDRHYVTDMLNEAAHSSYFDYTRRQQSLTYNFRQDLDTIFDQRLDNLFNVSTGSYPQLVLMSFNKKVTIETMVILDDFIHYTKKFDVGYRDDFLWPKVSLKIRKYRPFLKYDKQKLKSALKDKIAEQNIKPWSNQNERRMEKSVS